MNTITSPFEMDESKRLNGLSDEIDLLELLRSIGQVWKHWLIALTLVLLVFTGVQIVLFLTADSTTTYKKAIKFTFPGVEKSIYPNQSPFQLGDIIAPAIVSKVYETNNLSAYNISIEKFRSALLIEPYDPTYALIVQKFNQQLNNNKLSTAEIQALQSQMASELALATSGAALLMLTLDNKDLPQAVVGKVLADIPATWAKHAINDKGVLNLNIQLASSNSLDDELISNIDYMVISEMLKEKMALVKTNIKKLLKFDGASTISDPVTGVGLADLQQKVNDLQHYVIDELMSPIRSLGLTKNSQLSLYYYKDKKRTLTDMLNLQLAQAALVKEAFENYFPNQQPVMELTSQTSNRGDFPVISSQMSADALEKILALSSEGKTEEFRQSLSRQWLDLHMKAAEITNQISDADRTITLLSDNNEDTMTQSLKESHLNRAEKALPKILNQVRGYLDITQRIYKQLSLENTGVTGRLYRPITNEPFIKTGWLNLKRTVLILAGLLFLTSIIVVPVCVIRNAMNKKLSA